MTAESDLFTALTTDTTIGAQITQGGSPEEWRLYPNVAPSIDVKPFVVYNTEDSDRFPTLDGLSNLRNARITVSIYADEFATAKTLADLITARVDDQMNVGDFSEQSFFEKEDKLHRVLLRFSLW